MQVVKTGRPKNTVRVATYFRGHGKKIWHLKLIVICSIIQRFFDKEIKWYAINSS
jgi:hypothetical protein